MIHNEPATRQTNTATLPIIIGIGILATTAMGYLLYRTIQKKKNSGLFNPGSTNKQITNLRSSGFACISTSYPLQVGTCHKDVKLLQQYLLQKGGKLGSSGSQGNGIDGQFGEKTRKAASQYLRKTAFSQKDILQLQTKINRHGK